MAKQKAEKVIESVELKDPNEVIDLPRVGLYITKQTLTIDRYLQLIGLSDTFKEKFNVLQTMKGFNPSK